jgi:HAMP domain-containing protein
MWWVLAGIAAIDVVALRFWASRNRRIDPGARLPARVSGDGMR